MKKDSLHQYTNLTEGPIAKRLLQFFFPIMFGMLFQQLYNTVDAVIVGKFIGPDALAAVGGSPAVIVNLIIGFFNGIASGATVLISQLFGANEKERLEKMLHTVITFSLISGVLLSVAAYFLAPSVLAALSTPADIIGDSILYLRIFFSGTVALLLFNVGSGILRAVGDSRRPLLFLAVCCVLNIGLDILFVAVFRMGVAGVAWATVLSLFVSAALVVAHLLRVKEIYRLRIRMLKIDGGSLLSSLRIGIPAGIQSMMFSFSNLIIQIAINKLGTIVIASWTACGKIDGVYWVISNAFGAAICAFSGQNFGAGKYSRLKQGARVCLGIAVGTSVFLSVLLLTLSRYGMRILTDDPEVISLSCTMLTYLVPFYFIWSFIEIISSVLRGVGDSFRPTLITVLGVCGVRILWVLFVVPQYNTVFCVSIVYGISWVVTAVAFLIYYLKSDWLKRSSARLPGGEISA